MIGWVFVTLAVTCIWTLYKILMEPIPRGFSRPFVVKLSLCVLKLVGVVAFIGYKCGAWRIMEGYRLLLSRLARLLPDQPGVKYEDTSIGGVPVRVYTPTGGSTKPADGPATTPGGAPRAGIVWCHGGGWISGSADTAHSITSVLADKVPAVVVSVGYRLAPENPFPAAVDDCLTVTRHFLSNCTAQYGVSSSKVIIAGDSCGGNLAAAVSIALRDERCDVKPAAQVLIYPLTQVLDLNTPSYQQNAKGPLLTRQATINAISVYITGSMTEIMHSLNNNDHVIHDVRAKMATSFLDHSSLPQNYLIPPYQKPTAKKGDRETWEKIKTTILNPRLSPLAATDLKGLPRAFIYTCHHDVLRDDGALYGMRLRKAGNNVSLVNSPIGFHGILSLAAVIPEARRDLDRIIVFIQECIS